MLDIPVNLKQQLYSLLARSAAFNSDRELRAFFIDSRLVCWRNRIPDNTPHRDARITLLVDALVDQYNERGENALVLFLRVLAEHAPLADELNTALLQLANTLDTPNKATIDKESLAVNGISSRESKQIPAASQPKALLQVDTMATMQDTKINQTVIEAPVNGGVHIGDKIYNSNLLSIPLLLSILIITVGVSMYLFLRFKKPSQMRGDFRIAVASFAIDDQIADPDMGEELAQNFYTSLQNAFDQTPLDFVVSIWGPEQVGKIRGQSQEDRTRAAEQLAHKIDADVIVYGWVESTDNIWQIVPEFYISAENFYEGQEITGPYNMGTAIYVAKQQVELLTRFEVNSELFSRAEALSYITIGIVHYSSRDPEHLGKALDYFQLADEVKNWDAQEGKQVLYLLMGGTAFKLNDLELAKTYYRKSLTLDPEYARAYLGLAGIFYMQALEFAGEAEEPTGIDISLLNKAIDTYTRALEMPYQPPFSDVATKVHFGLGQCYFALVYSGEKDSFNLAISEFEAVIAEYSDGANPRVLEAAAESYARLGLIYDLSGYPDLAIENYKMAVSLSTNLERQAIYEERWREIASKKIQ